MTNSLGILEQALLAASRSRASWNDRFQHWERPASDTEEAQIERTASEVRQALRANRWLASEGVMINPQGSYHNNTNVRREADMDLCALHPMLAVEAAPGVPYDFARAQVGGYYHTGQSNWAVAARMRDEIVASLNSGSAFGPQVIRHGPKAVTVSGVPNSRAPVDIVPAVRLHYLVQISPLSLAPSFRAIEGIAIFCANGRIIRNFPQQHHENGIAKRACTGLWFKKVVRSLKSLRDELVGLGRLQDGQVPSFLIECLVYRVEDEFFVVPCDDRYDRVRRVLLRIRDQLANDLYSMFMFEINDVKPLFANTQPWTVGDVRTFVAAALARLAA